MRWKASLEEGYVKKVPLNAIRARSLLKSSEQALASALKITVETDSLKTILRELYEGFHQIGEALGYQRGYKFSSHEAIKYFMEEVLKEDNIAAKFDRYRKIRNGINYYGDEVSEEAVQEARKEIPALIEKLKKHLLIDKEKEIEKN